MIERSFGHYVRVLVDLNLTQKLRDRILVERKGYAFFVDVEYENLPDYCTFCKCTGHYLEICNRNKDLKKDSQVKEQPTSRNKNTMTQLTYVPKQKEPEHVVLDVSTPQNMSPRNEEDVQLEKEVNEALLNNIVDNPDQGGMSIDGATVRNEDEQTSDGSEFVDATQTNAMEELARIDDDAIDEVQDEVVRNDIKFLKNSWAHMIETDDNDAELSPTAADASVRHQGVRSNVHTSPKDQITDEQGFTLVTTKATKKLQKAKVTSSSRHNTRSKVGTSNPLR